jgi:hypothetical protein
MNEQNEQPTEPTLVLNTESVEYNIGTDDMVFEYNIVGADAIDSNRPGTLVIDTDKSSPKKITISDIELQAQQMAMLRRMVLLEQRRELRKRHKENTKSKNRRQSKIAKASRKRNR